MKEGRNRALCECESQRWLLFWQYSGREDASNDTGPFEMEKKVFLNMKKIT